MEVAEAVLVEDEVGDGGNVAATVGMVRWMSINILTVLLLLHATLFEIPSSLYSRVLFYFLSNNTSISCVNIAQYSQSCTTYSVLLSFLYVCIPL